jgi:putative ABC transport system permease protein
MNMAAIRFLRVVFARLRALFRRDAIAAEIREELEFHLHERTEQYEREGLTSGEAGRKARLRIGNLAVHQDCGYDVRGGGVMETIVQDLRYSLRLLARQRGFSTLAILTLAVGIGASTAIFSVIDVAVLRPLPYADPEQLVELRVRVPQRSGHIANLGPSLDDMRTWIESGRVFSHLGAWRRVPLGRIIDGPEPERVRIAEITEDYLGVFGVKPVLGRDFTRQDLDRTADPVVLIGYGYWQSRLGGDRSVIGRQIHIDGASAAIVGVLPPTFYRDTPIWRPLSFEPQYEPMRGMGTTTVGRLRPEVALAGVAGQLTALLPPEPPGRSGSPTAQVQSMLEVTAAGSTTTVTVLTEAVGLILLIACVNVAGLLLVRGATRQAELAVRTSIGAGRIRLVRQLLTESLVLAMAGGLVGVLIAWIALDVLIANLPMALPPNSHATLSLPVLGASLVLTLTTGVLFGLLPALRLSRVGIGAALGGASRRIGSSLSRRSGQLLIGAEVSLAVVLLAGAGLMIRSFGKLVAVDMGFETDALVAMQVTPVEPSRATQATFYSVLLDSIRKLPAVAAAGAVDHLPLSGGAFITHARIAETEVSVNVVRVLPGFFEAMGIQIGQGRDFTDTDVSANRPVAVINEEAQRRLFAARPAAGQRFELAERAVEVIGVAGNIRSRGPLAEVAPEVYLPFQPTEDSLDRALALSIVVRPKLDARGLDDQLSQAAKAIGPRVVIENIRSGSELFGERVVTPRKRTFLLGLLGALGFGLTLVGIFGMTAYAVARRTQEIGVRMAFGAQPGDVVARMVREAAAPIVLGTIFGLAVAAIATRAIASFLFNTTPTDPATFVGVAVTLGAAGALAAWLPARRAARVDPVVALRME